MTGLAACVIRSGRQTVIMNFNDQSLERSKVQTFAIAPIANRIKSIARRRTPPDSERMRILATLATNSLRYENRDLRPGDRDNLGGGLVLLDHCIETILIPDIHARLDLMLSTLFFQDERGRSVLDRLATGDVQVVCVGDGMHAESRAAKRWQLAQREYVKRFRRHKYMDEEMRESLGVMEMILELTIAFPARFHYLKGNHDNIKNENGNGNHSFMKFALEGPMVTEYILKFYGADFLRQYDLYEKSLPLLAVGRDFLVSHAEPLRFFSREEILNYREHPEVVEGLTWTADGYATEGSTQQMLAEYLRPEYWPHALYFGGHRPVKDLYHRRARGRYVQIHNPNRFIIARLMPGRAIHLDSDIIEIQDLSGTL